MSLSEQQIEESLTRTDDDDILSLLANIVRLDLNDDSQEKLSINCLNRQLSIPASRMQGLEFLNLLILSYSAEIIAEHGLNWLNYCTVQHDVQGSREVKLLIIAKIIEETHQNHEFSKKFVALHLTKVLEFCISSQENIQETKEALKTLTICLNHYHSWLTIHKSKLENFLLMFLDHPSNAIAVQAGVAFLYLQTVGGADVEGLVYKNNFTSAFNKLCITAHLLFDVLFEKIKEVETHSFENEDSFLSTLPTVDSNKLVARRIINCITFLRAMLAKGFPVAKEIQPMYVLRVISRGVMLHLCVQRKGALVDDYEYALLVLSVKAKLFKLLRTLIIWLKTNSLPFTDMITTMFTQCYLQSQDCKCCFSNKEYQKAILDGFMDWIKYANTSIGKTFQTNLVGCISRNITPPKNEISLTMMTDHNKSNKSKQKAMQNRIIASGQRTETVSSLSSTGKEDQILKCSMALDILIQLLKHTYFNISDQDLKELTTVVVQTLINLNSENYHFPYTDVNCQVKLYQVLVGFFEQEHLNAYPSLALSIDILCRGANSRHKNVRDVCQRGLVNLEKVCQPMCPPLSFVEAELVNAVDVTANLNTDNTEALKANRIKSDSIDNIVEMETDDLNNSNGTTENNSEQQQSADEEIQFKKTVHVIDVTVIPAEEPVVQFVDKVNEFAEALEEPHQLSEHVAEDEDSLSGTETVIFESYVQEQSIKVSVPPEETDNHMGEAEVILNQQLTNGTVTSDEKAHDHNESCTRKLSPTVGEELERPSKISKLDLQAEQKSEASVDKPADTKDEFNVSDDEFVDEIKEY